MHSKQLVQHLCRGAAGEAHPPLHLPLPVDGVDGEVGPEVELHEPVGLLVQPLRHVHLVQGLPHPGDGSLGSHGPPAGARHLHIPSMEE